MTLPSSGPLSIGDISGEFGGVPPLPLSDYYAGGPFVPAGTIGDNGPIPSAGEIKISDFYGSAFTIAFVLTSVDLGGGNSFGFKAGVGGNIAPPTLLGQTIDELTNGSIVNLTVEILGNNLPQTFWTGLVPDTGEPELLSANASIFDTNAGRAQWIFGILPVYNVGTFNPVFRP